jgi:cytochrome c oxidase subunit 2
MKRILLTGVAAIAVAGCEGRQSILAPEGSDAAAVAELSHILFIGGGVIFVVVIALTLYAMRSPQTPRQWMATHRFILGGGLLFPIVTLTILLTYGLGLTGGVGRSVEPAALGIDVTGEQFWWRVRYQERNGAAAVDSANEIHVPVGQPVALTLRSPDVIHSFWVPNLAGKLDMIPGQDNRMTIRAIKPGVYRGQCAEYCGIQHAQMAFYVVAHPAAEFDRWLETYRQPAADPATEDARHGRELFLRAGCGACHAIRGTEAAGTIGPDLTHIGSRRSIGAGMLPNTAAVLADWIGSSQHIKPGNRMPSFELIAETERRAIAAYLEALK